MSVQADQLLFRFLSQVGDIAHGVLPPSGRVRLIATLRSRIEQDRVRLGVNDPASMRKLLASYGEPRSIVAAEAQRTGGPDSGTTLTPTDGPAVPVSSPDWNGASSGSLTSVRDFGAEPGDEPAGPSTAPVPEMPIDPDPFMDTSTAGVPLAAPEVDQADAGSDGESENETTMTTLPVVPASRAPGEELAPPVLAAGWQDLPWQQRIRVWVRRHPRESITLGLFLVGLIIGSWIPVVLGYLAALTSYAYSAQEKRFAMIGVPAATLLAIGFGFWLDRTGNWGGTKLDRTSFIGEVGTMFATVPRVLAAFALLYLGWRLARKLAREG